MYQRWDPKDRDNFRSYQELHDLAKILKDLREQNYLRESFAFPSAFPCAHTHKKSYTVFQVFHKCSSVPTDGGCSTLANRSYELLAAELTNYTEFPLLPVAMSRHTRDILNPTGAVLSVSTSLFAPTPCWHFDEPSTWFEGDDILI